MIPLGDFRYRKTEGTRIGYYGGENLFARILWEKTKSMTTLTPEAMKQRYLLACSV